MTEIPESYKPFLEEVLAELLEDPKPDLSPDSIAEAMRRRIDAQRKIAFGYRMNTPVLGRVGAENKVAPYLAAETYRRLPNLEGKR